MHLAQLEDAKKTYTLTLKKLADDERTTPISYVKKSVGNKLLASFHKKKAQAAPSLP